MNSWQYSIATGQVYSSSDRDCWFSSIDSFFYCILRLEVAISTQLPMEEADKVQLIPFYSRADTYNSLLVRPKLLESQECLAF